MTLGDCEEELRKIEELEAQQEPEYVKVSFEKASDAAKGWEDGELYILSGENYTQLETAQEVLTYLFRLYRKVER